MNDAWVGFIVTGAIMIALFPLIFIFSKERFYQKDINRWRPGINMPVLRVPVGTKIDFKKFQRDIRIHMSIFIGIFTLATLGLMLAYGLGIEKDDNLGPIFWAYMVLTVVWTVLIIVWTVKTFPKRASKYVIE